VIRCWDAAGRYVGAIPRDYALKALHSVGPAAAAEALSAREVRWIATYQRWLSAALPILGEVVGFSKFVNFWPWLIPLSATHCYISPARLVRGDADERAAADVALTDAVVWLRGDQDDALDHILRRAAAELVAHP